MGQLTTIERKPAAATQGISAELLQRFISYLDATPKTIETYTRNLRQLFNYFAMNGIRYPQREDIIAFRDELKSSGHKPTTVQSYITAARLFFSWAATEGLYPNIAEHIKGAKLNRDHKKDYLTSRQVKDVLAHIDRDTLQGKRDYALLFMMITCGLRTIEAVRANVEDVRTLGNDTVIYVQGKGREEKTDFIRVTAPAERALREYLKARGTAKDTEPLFVSTSNNNKGRRMTTRSVSAISKRSLQRAGFDSPRLTAHSLRHTAVTLSLLAGKRIEEVQQFARHANITTTMIYNHSLDLAKNSCSEAITEAITN